MLKEKSVAILNLARATELQAIKQYMQHHYRLEDLEYSELAEAMKDIAIQEMRHAEYFAQRILELGGKPVNADAGLPLDGAEELDRYINDVLLEDDTQEKYREYITALTGNQDYVSAELLKKVLIEEEQHRQYFSAVVEKLMAFGDAYLGDAADKGYEKVSYAKFIY